MVLLNGLLNNTLNEFYLNKAILKCTDMCTNVCVAASFMIETKFPTIETPSIGVKLKPVFTVELLGLKEFRDQRTGVKCTSS